MNKYRWLKKRDAKVTRTVIEVEADEEDEMNVSVYIDKTAVERVTGWEFMCE